MSKAKDIILKNVKTKSQWVFKNTKQFDSTDLKRIRLLQKAARLRRGPTGFSGERL